MWWYRKKRKKKGLLKGGDCENEDEENENNNPGGQSPMSEFDYLLKMPIHSLTAEKVKIINFFFFSVKKNNFYLIHLVSFQGKGFVSFTKEGS